MNNLLSVGKDLLAKGQNVNLDDDMKDAHKEAQASAGSSGNSELFSSVLGALSQKKPELADGKIDEQDAVQKHDEAYNKDSGNHDANSLGTAAAMQAMKLFNQRGSEEKQSQGAFVGLALSEASKLFDSKSASGQVPSGTSKESVIQKAGEMAMKMFLQNKVETQGAGGLMDMASKFLK